MAAMPTDVSQGLAARRTPHGRAEPASRAQHTPRLLQCDVRVRDQHEAHAKYHGVERRALEVDRRRVDSPNVDSRGSRCERPGDLHHFGRDVAGEERASGLHQCSKSGRQLAVAAAEFENTLPRCERQPGKQDLRERAARLLDRIPIRVPAAGNFRPIAGRFTHLLLLRYSSTVMNTGMVYPNE